MNSSETSALVYRLKREIESRSLTQKELAEKSGVAQSTLSKLISGLAKTTSRENGQKIATYLGIPFEAMTTGTVIVESSDALNIILKSDGRKIVASIVKGLVEGLTGGITGVIANTGDILRELGSMPPEQQAWVLVSRSASQAVGELTALLEMPNDRKYFSKTDSYDAFCSNISEDIQVTIDRSNLVIDHTFLNDPVPGFVEAFLPKLEKQLSQFGIPQKDARNIGHRFKVYFNVAIATQLQTSPNHYGLLLKRLTPADPLLSSYLKWQAYRRFVERLPCERVFNASFALDKVFIDLRSYFDSAIVQSVDDEGSQPDQSSNSQNIEKRSLDSDRSKTNLRTFGLLVDLLTDWLTGRPHEKSIFVSGGPGSGKSSSVKMYACKLAALYSDHLGELVDAIVIPLHKLPSAERFIDSLKEFCIKHQPPMPIDWLEGESEVTAKLIFLDGLDELSQSGKDGPAAANDLVRRVRDWQGMVRNQKIRTIFIGRPIATHWSKSHAEDSKIVELLPFDIKKQDELERPSDKLEFRIPEEAQEEYEEQQENDKQTIARNVKKFLSTDQRVLWWKKFAGANTAVESKAVPSWMKGKNLKDLTSEPLICYLVSESYLNNKDGFEKDLDANRLYQQMLEAVRDRVHSESGPLASSSKFDNEMFVETLEDIGLATFHHAGRAIGSVQLEPYLSDNSKQMLITAAEKQDSHGHFRDGLVKLMVSFFVRAHGGWNSAVFEFTHKSFAEYLAARRLMYGVVTSILKKWYRHKKTAQSREREGWDTETALLEWIRLFGQVRLTNNVIDFFAGELRRLAVEFAEVEEIPYSKVLHELRMMVLEFLLFVQRFELPMHRSSISTDFKEMRRGSRFAEEAMFVVHHQICALMMEHGIAVRALPGPENGFCDPESSELTDANKYQNVWPTDVDFSSRVIRIIGKLNFVENSPIVDSLSFLDLRRANLWGMDLRQANLRHANLEGVDFGGANLWGADLEGAGLEEANLRQADLRQANLRLANLAGADVEGANLGRADRWWADRTRAIRWRPDLIEYEDRWKLDHDISDEDALANLRRDYRPGANLGLANLAKANFGLANLAGAILRQANLVEAKLLNANLMGADLTEADLRQANLWQANLRQADLVGADLRQANLWQAKLGQANLAGANLAGANLRQAELGEADLGGADLTKANLQHANLASANLADARVKKGGLSELQLKYIHGKPIFVD